MNAKCQHKLVKALVVLEDDGNVLKVLFQCKLCKHIFTHTFIKC